jgi:hypothetical protein
MLVLLVGQIAHAQTTVGPAPTGDAAKVALREIRRADHPCPKVRQAVRAADGSIRAVCSNGEDYLIASMSNPKHGLAVVALRCSAARRLLNVNC